MSLSLIGIILVQVYWFNSSFKTMTNNLNFVKQVIGNVADKLQNKAYSFYDKYNRIKIVLVKRQKRFNGVLLLRKYKDK
jgi:two-component system phosphate regulon sensor histidine kinase PhoR